MVEQRGPRHALRPQVVNQRSALPLRQRLAAASDEHLSLLKQLARGAADRRRSVSVGRICNRHVGVGRIKLSTRESVVTAEERELLAAPNQKNLRIARIGLVTKQDHCCGVFGN